MRSTRGLTRRRLASTLLPTGVLVGSLGVAIGRAPALDQVTAAPAELPGGVAVAAVVAGDGEGFVLDRDGDVLRVAGDGGVDRVASLGRRSTPFGTWYGGLAVFGGVRCRGDACRARQAELTAIDATGRVRWSTTVVRVTGRAPPLLDGMALVGVDGDTVWVVAAGRLYQVDAAGDVVADVTWPGGEACLVAGRLHDLSATAGSYGSQGEGLPASATFDLQVRTWDGAGWQAAPGGATRMRHGRNAYCAPGGYEIRDAGATLGRWRPGGGWRAVAGGDGAGAGGTVADPSGSPGPPGPPAGASEAPGGPAPVTSSSGRRYAVAGDGSLVALDEPGGPRRTAVTVLGATPTPGAPPPAVQVDDAAGWLFACVSHDPDGTGTTRCTMAGQDGAGAAEPPPGPGAAGATEVTAGTTAGGVGGPGRDSGAAVAVHHYNMCSAACGDGVRPHTRDVVAHAVAAGRPMALSLNETCYDDLVHLGGRWPAGFGAGAGYVALETATNCPGAVKRFGNSVLVRAGQAGASARWAQFPTQSSGPCDNRARECRGMACAATGEGGRRSVFCTAHLEPRRHGPAVAAAQADEYLRLANGGETRIETTTAGDFNLTPAEVDARFAPLGYRAARTGPTFAGHGRSGSAPIDMIYRRGPAPASPPVATTTCDARASDHCYLVQAWEPAPVSVGG